MVDVLEIVSSEAAKVAATAVVGRVDQAAEKLFRLVRGKLGGLSGDPDEVRAKVLSMARSDPEWAAELVELVSALNSGRAGAEAPRGIELFRNHARYLADPPRAGMKLISGPSGSGRTELARQLADRVAGGFPAGRVEIDMDRFRSGDVLDMAEVKRFVLLRFGIPEAEIAVDDDRLDRQFHSVLATRSFVAIVDNVVSERDLEPFALFRGNLVLAITAKLTRGLALLDRDPIILRGLDRDGAEELLADYSGQVRLADEPAEARELLELCGRMPFALREAGLTLARRFGEPRPVAGLLAEYRAAGVVGAEDAINESLRRTFDSLEPEKAQACALLSAFPGNWFTRATAAAYIGGPGAAATVDAVFETQLTERSGGWHRISTLAAQYASRIPADRDAAFGRLLRYVRDHAVAADLAGDPKGEPGRLREYVVPTGLAWVLPEDRFEWLDHHFTLVGELVRAAYWRRDHKEACQLAGAIEVLVNQRGRWREYGEISEWAVQAATVLHTELSAAGGDGRPAQLARALQMRAKARFLARWFEPAEADLTRAQQLAEQAVLPDARRRRLLSSIAEFWGRFHEERADSLGPGRNDDRARLLAEAASRMRTALELDGDHRYALGIHWRMLASILVKSGQLDEALDAVNRAWEHTAERNRGRVDMVAAKAYAAGGDSARARVCLDRARAQLERVRADQYHWELREIDARILVVEGKLETARRTWGQLVHDAFTIGHPRADDYLAELGSLPG